MKTKAHTRYRLDDGTIVPGATTIVGLLAKPALIKWANNLGMDGIDSARYVDDKADIGTLAHSFITDGLRGMVTGTADYSENQIQQAKNCVASYSAWGHKIELILIEQPLSSEKFEFGGTPDIYGKVDGVLELIDLKTGSAIWPEFIIQVAAYRQLLQEAGHSVERVRLLNIPRCETESFQELIPSDAALDKNWQIFHCLLQVYNIQRELK